MLSGLFSTIFRYSYKVYALGKIVDTWAVYKPASDVFCANTPLMVTFAFCTSLRIIAMALGPT
jgi:hypothetical protein